MLVLLQAVFKKNIVSQTPQCAPSVFTVTITLRVEINPQEAWQEHTEVAVLKSPFANEI